MKIAVAMENRGVFKKVIRADASTGPGRAGLVLSVPRWAQAPSKYEQYWIRYSAAAIAAACAAHWVYMCAAHTACKATPPLRAL